MARVTPIASFGGLYDFVLQRISAVVIAAYFLFILGYLMQADGLTYDQWVSLFSAGWMKVFSTITLLMLLAHVWIGVWGVLTDYVTTRLMGPRANLIRMLLEVAVLAVVLIVAVVGLATFWSV